MKKIFGLLFFLFSLSNFSQFKYLDQLPNSFEDTTKLNTENLLNLSDYYLTRDLNKCLEIIKLAEEKKVNDELKGLLNLAYANYYIEVGFFDIALEKALRSFSLLENTQNKRILRSVRSTIARIDRQNNNIEKAINEYRSLIAEIKTSGPSLELGGYYLALANTLMYVKDDELKNVLNYIDLAFNIFKKQDNKTGQGIAYLRYARYYKLMLFKKNDKTFFKKTEDVIKKALKIFEELHQTNNEAYGLYTYGTLFSISGDHKSSIPYYELALKKYKDIGQLYFTMKISQHLFVSYSILNKNTLALNINRKYIKLKDSIFNIKKRKFIADAEVKFEVAKIKSEKKIAELSSKKSRYLLIGSIIIFVLLTLLLIFYFERLRAKKRIEFVKLELQETQKRLAIEKMYNDSELKALKSQMNPHFIFNALNSIQDYIILNEKKLARQYLIKFSRLIRIYLEQTQKQSVTLFEEIKALELYLGLEKDRFNDDFSYDFKVDDQLDLENIYIPSLLLQPYVENALKHGLLHKNDNKKLNISFDKDNTMLVCKIKDNGIGRKASAVINQKRNRHHTSFATSANQKRVDLLNQSNDICIDIEIKDLYQKDKAIGTEIIVKIPLSY